MKAWLLIPFIAFGIGIHLVKNAWAALLLYHLLLLLPLVVHRKHWQLSNLCKGFSGLWLLIHLVGSAAVGWLLFYLAQALGFDLVAFHYKLSAMGVSMGFTIYFVLVNPIFEEIFWRDLMAKKTSSPTLEDIAFGSFHVLILLPFLPWTYAIAFALGLCVIAYIWRQLRWRYNGLAIPWLGHVIGDSLFVTVITLLLLQMK